MIIMTRIFTVATPHRITHNQGNRQASIMQGKRGHQCYATDWTTTHPTTITFDHSYYCVVTPLDDGVTQD